MNKNKVEDKTENIEDMENENIDSDNIPSNSSNLKALYNDLLNTLNTPEKSSHTASPGDDIAPQANTGQPPHRTNNLTELLNMIDAKTTKTEVPKNEAASDTSASFKENSFKDNIVNSEIFDSVLNDLNKQKVERSEKKKERDAKGADETPEIRDNKFNILETPEISTVSEKKPLEEDVKEYVPFSDSRDNTSDTGTSKSFESLETSETAEIYSGEDGENIGEAADKRRKPTSNSGRQRNGNSSSSASKNGAGVGSFANKAKTKNTTKADDENEDELLKAFGINYDDEESERLDSIPDGKNAGASKRIKSAKSQAKLKSLHQLVNGEYMAYDQNSDIFAGYSKIFMSEWIKFGISTICLLFLLYIEIAPHFKLPLPYILDTNFYNVIYILTDLQILLIVAWLNYDSLVFGVKSIFASVVNIYYITIFLMLLTFIHTLFTYILRYNNPDMVLFNSVTVFGLVLVGLYNILDINIEIMGFKVVSSKKLKYAFHLNERAVLEMDEFRDIIPENTSVGNIVRTNFINNFFSRTTKKKIYGSYEKYFLTISASVAALLFAVLLGFKVDKYTALSSSVTVMLCSVPLCSVIVSIFPMYKAQKRAYGMASAVIGAESVNEYSEVSIISVHDRDIFPPEQAKISGVRVYGNNRLETVLQHFRAVFETLNLALADSFKSSTTYENNFDRRVDIISVAEDGICFMSNGRKLFMGNGEYISNIGLSVNYDQNFDEQFLKSSGSILFLSSDREVISKICVKYEIVPEFFDILKSLNKANVCLGIRTFDPNIDNALLRRLANLKKLPVKVIKLKNLNDIYIPPESMESGIVSKSSLKSFIKTLLLCNKAKSVIKSNILIQIIAFIAGLGFTTIITVIGIMNDEIWTLNSLYVLLFQIFWMFPILFLSGLSPN